MANTLSKQVIEEGYRNAVVKLSGVLDTADVSPGQLSVLLTDFSNNDDRAGVLTGLRVDAVIFSLGVNLDGVLAWRANTPQPIMAISKTGKIDVSCDGGLIPDLTASGRDGGIDFSTAGYAAGTTQVFTATLRLVKLYK